MLIAIFILLGSLFGSTYDHEDKLKNIVPDSSRRAEATAVLGEITTLHARLNKAVEEGSAQIRKIHLNYEATREDYLLVLHAFEEERAEITRGLLAAHTQLHAVLSKEEWQELFPAPQDKL
jgi:hypothetical protein